MLYTALVLSLSLAVRVAHTLLKAIRVIYPPRDPLLTYRSAVCRGFMGLSLKEGGPHEYWYVFILGSFEMAAYPVLIATNFWTAVGAWIGLKTVAQWSTWTTDRTVFNLFLVGNLLVLASAYAFLAPLVEVS